MAAKCTFHPLPAVCPSRAHEALKALGWLWAMCPRGRHGSVQVVPLDEEAIVDEVRDCPCGSTLYRRMEVVRA